MTDWADADLTVAVVGAGAIGCRIAAHLDNEGIACTLFDGWHEHVEAIRREGLHFEHGELSSQHNLQAHHYEDATLAPGPYDVVLLCTRSDGTAAVLPLVKRLLKDDGCVVSCQNGINEEAIAAAVGADRTLGCSLIFGARLSAPGCVVSLPGADTFHTGEMLGGESTRVARIAQMFSACGTSDMTRNLMGYRWTKLVLNSCGNPMMLLTGLSAGKVHALPQARNIMIGIAREVILASRAAGDVIEPILDIEAEGWLDDSQAGLEKLHATLASHGDALGERRLSMVADFEARGKTEVDYINGHVVRKSAQHHLAAPLNARVVELVHSLENGRAQSGLHMLNLLETKHA